MLQELSAVVGEYYACILLGIDQNILNNLTIENNNE